MDELHVNEASMQMPDTYYHPQMQQQQQEHDDDLHQLTNDNMIHHDPDNHNALLPAATTDDTNQLTLSFQGQVYVFDSVSTDKVQAVLLLLGGCEDPATASMPPYIPLTHNQNNRDLSSNSRRLASLMRFREKRKSRNFDKKILYTVRKEVALGMKRHKGQFTSSKATHEDASTSWDSNQSWHSDGSGNQHQETVCRHCGVNEKSTPMMRKGPDGPKTLCNACGLMWANKFKGFDQGSCGKVATT
ncbi:GATA transcription factor 28-like isoform X2 [Bidens hawaiensis]|uniref:GATA transcription factor 28-like isoform X2 n=1 Tax=Bidens hawaiensis TaxID=980011 RepID=UPI004049B22B